MDNIDITPSEFDRVVLRINNFYSGNLREIVLQKLLYQKIYRIWESISDISYL